jgi:hypothetical protein
MTMIGCGTSSSTTKSITGPTLSGPVYMMGTCSGADEELCSELREQFQYCLLKNGLYAKQSASAQRRTDLTITSYRDVWGLTRGALGVMSGKDGLDVRLDVIDIASGDIIGSSSASSYNYSAANMSRSTMMSDVTNKLMEFLTHKD